MTEALIFLIKAFLDLFSVAILITFLFRLLRVDYYNPIVQGMIKIADMVTSRLRRIFKPVFGIDFASLIVVFFFQAICFYLIILSGNASFEVLTMFAWSLFSILLLGLRIIYWTLILGVILSWTAPTNSHPAIRLLQHMTDQICNPFRIFLPPMGGLDLSPILAFLIINFIYLAIANVAFGAGLPMNLSVGM